MWWLDSKEDSAGAGDEFWEGFTIRKISQCFPTQRFLISDCPVTPFFFLHVSHNSNPESCWWIMVTSHGAMAHAHWQLLFPLCECRNGILFLSIRFLLLCQTVSRASVSVRGRPAPRAAFCPNSEIIHHGVWERETERLSTATTSSARPKEVIRVCHFNTS